MKLAFFALLLPAAASADDWPMWGGRPDRNMVSAEKGLPVEWNAAAKKNIKWIADLGNSTYGNPVVAGGRVYIGTNNGKPRDPAVKGDKGVLMCFSEKDGAFQWQAVHDKLPTGDAEDWSKIGICSIPCVAGDRVYYVSNRGELVCCDAAGFSDKENDGPIRDEKRSGEHDADLVWIIDMRAELGITAHQASASSPLVVGDLVFVLTGQGVDLKAEKVKNPGAPSFIAVHKDTGKVVWQDASPGAKIFAGQWGSPAFGVVDGVPQVAFPGGDGWLYAFEPATGKLLWKFNCNAHDKLDDKGLPENRNHLVATPVFQGHRVFISSGQDPEAGIKPGCVRAIDARKRGDITATGELWRLAGDAFECSISCVAVQDDLVYAVDLAGKMNCLEVATGKRVWWHDLLSTTWGSPLVADGKIYVRNGDGEVILLQAGREKKVIATLDTLPGLEHGSVVAANGTLYIAGAAKLYAVGSNQ